MRAERRKRGRRPTVYANVHVTLRLTHGLWAAVRSLAERRGEPPRATLRALADAALAAMAREAVPVLPTPRPEPRPARSPTPPVNRPPIDYAQLARDLGFR